MNGKDPTKGKDGKDGGYLLPADFFLSTLEKIETARNVTENQRKSVNRNIFGNRIFPAWKQ
jgi:hypothetical protein